MVSLYDILGVPRTATKDEIKRAYKTMAMKTHPDRFARNGVSEEEKKKAESEFQKVNAAYEVLSNDALRQQYDLTGEVPNNPSLGSTSSQSWAPNDQSNGWQGHRFGFGSDSFFNDQDPFRSPFFSSGFRPFGAFDSFHNDTFFNPRTHPRAANGFGGFPHDSFFRGFDDMMQDFMQPPSARTQRSNHRSSLFNPPMSPFFFGGSHQPVEHSAGQAIDEGVRERARPAQSTYFSSFTSATYSNGRWTSESSEESNINGVRKAQRQRTWVDDEGVQHVKRTRPDGTTQYLRNGVEHQRPNALPAPELITDHSARRSTRSGRH
ncbi:hypothetical protein FRC17_004648 [Serendipita sp. 399]|nr:hypothetical protein FRC17_004648 [Serendipita sp. 399]